MGAGHNALITAAYAAKAGYRVGVFERRAVPGGAVATEERVPGYQFDLGGSAHILIRMTPIVKELELSRYGLYYLDLDPMFHASDGETPWFVWRDAARTANELENLFPGQGEAYARFISDWTPFARAVNETFLSVPSPLELGRKLILGGGGGRGWQGQLRRILRPYGEVAGEYFSEERVRAPLTWMAAQSGPPPTEPISAPFLLWHPLYHEGGVARPKGGSGGLTKALARLIEAHGGTLTVSAPVKRILTEGPRATGVELASGERITGRAVVSGTHVLATAGALPPEFVPEAAREVRVGNGFGMVLRLALKEKVRYRRHHEPHSRVGLGLLIKNERQLSRAYGEYLAGDPTRDPPLIAMSFSAVDDSLAPPGGEVLWLWAQYYPYSLARGSWEERQLEVRDWILDAFEHYAPGTRENIVGELIQTPLWLERELGLYRGNVMHLEMTIDQMFALRPFLGAASYRWPGLRGLYMTGASTHPGGGIMGASGRNTARELLRDLSRRGWK
ncbi:phytoene desaturase family protein [Deinococcus peraridilitoris]|uniref:Pyridine nucleotide-disulfide oxidoreductase domain-containing protein 2 n=1 Tax=Deinococcus peraridilitoris (strain DSM 19664 / LMG 22246 / CIP 109416 / KR-200) TaxID=937777 RepID=L0A2J5_DEIPD|nr:NAD(P)/FAD-dependent oxidoreductase [Deinococcus peraridilitoris]AFZ68071.1 phytoene dehydrogenase-like oxidoreductase [Deinococcus peraridilitoris DSM 19664]